ncbi:hypothetical protein T08_4169 [Trichinella sp. T8]|nr:hypothetical protein T08_4169 [Trichinella sp. T8]
MSLLKTQGFNMNCSFHQQGRMGVDELRDRI